MPQTSVDEKRESELLFKSFCLRVMRMSHEEKKSHVRAFTEVSKALMEIERRYFANDPEMPERIRAIKREILMAWQVRSLA